MTSTHEPQPFLLNVNDDEANRYLVGRILRSHGFEVREAGTGRAALALAREQPQLVILDVQLPDISGYEVCRRLKQDPATARIPVLQTSATFVSAERKGKGLDSGADGYLAQPVEAVELVATVRALIRARQAEQGVRDAAREWQNTFDAIAEAVIVTDRSGRVLRANRAMRRLAGWDADPVGLDCGVLLGRVLPPQANRELGAWCAAQDRVVREVDGDGRWFRVSVDPSPGEDGDPDRVVITVRDTTRDRELEDAQRRRAEELAEANRRKDEFLAMLAHELRNPLNAIATANQVLARDDHGRDVRQRLRDTVDRQVRHLARMVDDLLDVSRLTRGRIQLHRAPLDLRDVVSEAIQMARSLPDARRQPIQVRVPREALPVDGDALRLQQVIVNLVNNASKYSEPGTPIVVACERDGGDVVVRVRDEGIGIPADRLESIFDLFVQVDQSLARSLGGLGLGLTLARTLVESHGGRVLARSEGEGRGAEFEVRLPAGAPLDAGVPPGAAGTARDPVSLSIVVIEDHPDTADLLQTVLASQKHRVQVRRDGTTGLDLALSSCPDVALIDIGLPGLDGYQVAQSLRTSSATRQTCLVAITGYGRPEDRARALEAGFDHYIVKPVDFNELDRVLHAATRATRRA